MTKTELRPLYTEAAARARANPSESELAVWLSKLGHFDIVDLKAAIDAHYQNSHWMPKESELSRLAGQLQHTRRSQGSGRTTYARWKCPDCLRIVGDFIQPTDFREKRCLGIPSSKRTDGERICGALMVQIFRGDNFSTSNSNESNDRPPDPQASWQLPAWIDRSGAA